jgi:hypothetical protein
MATVLARSAPPTADDPRQELQEIYEHLSERVPKRRVEIIAGGPAG